jgi:8-oxo-dGTP pyrophosphatase MutT (NUDIX family)
MCRDPVLSCGILLIDAASLPAHTDSLRILMVRRKDSMSYAEFIRGKYEPDNEEYLATLFRNMTLKEQSAIACENFDVLWRQMWGDERMSTDYTVSRDKFNQLDRLGLMRKYLSTYNEPEWGFPKGRRTRGECDMDCAVREFNEETNIPREAYVVLKNLVLEETFVGLNGVQYRHIYFVALLKSPEIANITQKMTAMQRREISGIAWKTFAEMEGLIRPHYSERRNMLTQLQSILESTETD